MRGCVPARASAKKPYIGNFVEVKNSEIGKGAKANHLTYLGDAKVGAGAKIGAGTITCNYDGLTKAVNEIGEGAFIGSDTALVALGGGCGRDHCRRFGDHQGTRRTRWRRARGADGKAGLGESLPRQESGRNNVRHCRHCRLCDAAPVILEALRRMEYRGYDSAGVCTVDDGQLIRRRAPGKLNNLVKELAGNPAPGTIGIAHTRWATHGAPTAANAHPHATEELALVHNGIIENFRQLREELTARGHQFESQTDSEVAAHLITDNLDRGMNPEEAAKEAVRRLTGAYSIAMIFKDHEGLLIGARKGAPMAVGYAEKEAYLGSMLLRSRLSPTASPIWKTAMSRWCAMPRFPFSTAKTAPPTAK